MDRGGVVPWAGLLLAACLASPVAAQNCAPTGRPRIAEVLYDATGDDTGHEFVELLNPDAAPVALSGARLEAGDGSGPMRWTLRWTAQATDTIAAFGHFVIGGAAVMPAPHAIANLDLQNGPDAVRMVWPDGATEVVGYGAHEFAEYFCLAPAPDVASGQSLARIPDEADPLGNAVDFRAATPSPGAPNQVRRDLALVPDSVTVDPPQPAPFTPWRLGITIVNHGADVVTESTLPVEITAPEGGGFAVTAEVAGGLAPGDRGARWVDMPGLAPGRWTLHAALRLAGDGRADNDSARVVLRVGPGPLEITEIQFHPAAGEGEWVEVRARGPETMALSDIRLADRSGAGGTPGGGQEPAPGGYALLVQSRAAFLARHPSLDSLRVWSVAPWPSLNNHDDDGGIADVVSLREKDGTPIESVAYSAAPVPAGYTLERAAGDVWVPAATAEGTPLAPPRLVPPAAGGFEVEPRRLVAPATGWLRWTLPWPRARVSFELYDLAGRRRATPLVETLLPGRGERRWDASDHAPGVYLVVLRARPESGVEELVLQRPIQIGGRP